MLAFEPPKFLIPGQIAEQELTLLFGMPGAGKSFVALDLALQVARTQPVLYLAGEGKSGFSLRYRGWQEAYKTPLGHITFTANPVQLGDAEDVEEFIADVEPLKPALIVLDTFATCTGGLNENGSDTMSVPVKACRRIIRETGAAVLLIHHAGWDNKHERGSTYLRGDVFQAIKVSQSKDKIITIASEKIRDGVEFEAYKMRIESGEGFSTAVRVTESEAKASTEKEVAEERLADDAYAMLLCLAECGPTGASVAEVAKKIGSADYTVRYRLKSVLVEQGLVFQEGRGTPYCITSTGLDVLAEIEDAQAAA